MSHPTEILEEVRGMTGLVVPLILCGAALYGQWKRVDVYGALVEGAGEGLLVLKRIAPTLVCLLTAVYMLRASEWAFALCLPAAIRPTGSLP